MILSSKNLFSSFPFLCESLYVKMVFLSFSVLLVMYLAKVEPLELISVSACCDVIQCMVGICFRPQRLMNLN